MNETLSITSSFDAATLTRVLTILQPLAMAHAVAETPDMPDKSSLRQEFADDHLETLLRVVEQKAERGRRKMSPEDAARSVSTSPLYQPA